MLKTECAVFSDFTRSSFGFQLSGPRVFALAVVAMVCAVCSVADAQERLHSGRITKSFTEPIEQSIAASAEVGIITLVHIKEGDRVRVGDSLADLNQAVLKESLAIAEARAESTARLDAATSELELIKSQLEAIRSLVEGGHTNKFEVEQKQSQYQSAFAEFRAAEDELKLAKLEVGRIKAQIGDRTIKSPINGFVTEIHKQIGENLSNTEPQYATIVRVDELKVRFYLDAATLRATKVGDLVPIQVGSQQSRVSSIVTFISPIIDPDSGLGRLDVKIDNQNHQIQSGIICFWNGEGQRTDMSVPRRDANLLAPKRRANNGPLR